MRLLEYIDSDGESPFGDWRAELDPVSRARVTIALDRLGRGNVSNVKSVGSGVQELRLDFGPGYRVYFGYDGPDLVILVAGGTKRRQQQDIDSAQRRWADYKRRKKE
jgi:putative addiction module killer protein